MQISELLFSPGFSRFSLASSRMLFLFFLCQHKTCKNINILLGKCLLGKAWGYWVPETRSCFLISLLRGLELNELKEHSWHWCFYKTKGSFQQRTSVVQILCTQPGFTLSEQSWTSKLNFPEHNFFTSIFSIQIILVSRHLSPCWISSSLRYLTSSCEALWLKKLVV